MAFLDKTFILSVLAILISIVSVLFVGNKIIYTQKQLLGPQKLLKYLPLFAIICFILVIISFNIYYKRKSGDNIEHYNNIKNEIDGKYTDEDYLSSDTLNSMVQFSNMDFLYNEKVQTLINARTQLQSLIHKTEKQAYITGEADISLDSLKILYHKLDSEIKILSQVSEKTLSSSDGYVLKEFIVIGDIKTTLYVVIIDPQKINAKIDGLTPTFPSGRSAIDIIQEEKSKIVFGSGFVTSFSPLVPNGFLKIDKKIISGLKKNGYNGIVSTKSNQLKLLNFREEEIDEIDEGFQTGPILISQGMLGAKIYNLKSNELANRAFVGINFNGKILIGITKSPVLLKPLSYFLLNTSHPDLKCKESMNLAGGGSETLVLKNAKDSVYKYGSYSINQSALICFY